MLKRNDEPWVWQERAKDGLYGAEGPLSIRSHLKKSFCKMSLLIAHLSRIQYWCSVNTAYMWTMKATRREYKTS
jgi:hypothetical protein